MKQTTAQQWHHRIEMLLIGDTRTFEDITITRTSKCGYEINETRIRSVSVGSAIQRAAAFICSDMNIGNKRYCTRCRRYLEQSEFYIIRESYYRSDCKRCYNIARSDYMRDYATKKRRRAA